MPDTANKKLKYDVNDLIGVFELSRNLGCDLLDRILLADEPIGQSDLSLLELHRQRLAEEGDFWNEEELKINFLAHLFYLANFREPGKINIFFERPLKAKINNITYNVICDCLLAKPYGVYAPGKPYFFLQEFKKQKQTEDAEGQMLLAMLITRHLNDNGRPMYGCWIQGRFWFFATLHGQQYCVSRAYDAARTEDLQQILRIMRRLKMVILQDLVE